jgi:hypothetical protein
MRGIPSTIGQGKVARKKSMPGEKSVLSRPAALVAKEVMLLCTPEEVDPSKATQLASNDEKHLQSRPPPLTRFARD